MLRRSLAPIRVHEVYEDSQGNIQINYHFEYPTLERLTEELIGKLRPTDSVYFMPTGQIEENTPGELSSIHPGQGYRIISINTTNNDSRGTMQLLEQALIRPQRLLTNNYTWFGISRQ